MSEIACTLPPETRAPRELNRVLVAGGAGFLGSHVCEAMLGNGAEVICVDNLTTGTTENVAHLSDSPGFSLLIQGAEEDLPVDGPLDAVLHLASPASPQDFDRLSIETLRAGSDVTFNLLALARAKGARFLFSSTSEVYGDPLEHPQTESYWGHVNPIGPRSVYDESKRFAEALVTAYRKRYGVDTVIVRLFNTYGPRMRADDGRVVPTFISQALTGRDLTVTGDGLQTRSVCYVDDMVRGILAAALSRHSGPINLGNPDERPIIDLAHTVMSLCGTSSSVSFVERPEDDPSRRRPDISLARSVLNWHPRVGPEEGLRSTIAWFHSRIVRC
ncbi:NAD-dependent epimerase/dehydratase family protein [Streptomyces sp. NL15-2K]|uniref:NAD-dependent epimerase/dehydratase family protein n=1 Tax=Streptomyces sp. NL15-2K TaxID=376149 RepID=UPI00209C66BB|nr:NAD-dependent epimerase/dehydratase family protein [Streptomyces sp. NL15-2K]